MSRVVWCVFWLSSSSSFKGFLCVYVCVCDSSMYATYESYIPTIDVCLKSQYVLKRCKITTFGQCILFFFHSLWCLYFKKFFFKHVKAHYVAIITFLPLQSVSSFVCRLAIESKSEREKQRIIISWLISSYLFKIFFAGSSISILCLDSTEDIHAHW